MKSIKCSANPDILSSHVCKIKPTRDGIGLLTTYVVLKKPLIDLWFHAKVYYKFRVFRPFMVEYDFDVCALQDGGYIRSIGFFKEFQKKR